MTYQMYFKQSLPYCQSPVAASVAVRLTRVGVFLVWLAESDLDLGGSESPAVRRRTMCTKGFRLPLVPRREREGRGEEGRKGAQNQYFPLRLAPNGYTRFRSGASGGAPAAGQVL